MTLNEYQEGAVSTAVYQKEHEIIYPALGLNGESGEVAEKVKKMLRDDNGVLTEERHAALVKELGDCLWYVAVMARDLGVNLEEVAELNLQKLASRKSRGVLTGSGDNR